MTAAQRSQLKETQAALLEKRQEADEKDQQIRKDTVRLVQLVDARSQEARDRERLTAALATAGADHGGQLERLRRRLAAEHEAQVRLCEVEAEARRKAALDSSETTLGPMASEWLNEADSELAAHLAHAEGVHRGLVVGEEQLAARLHEELRSVHAEVRLLKQERDSEAEAASVTHEAFLAEQRAGQRQGEMLMAEVRSQRSETDALLDAHRGLEGKARLLQHELTKVSYTVGQRDHEMKVKDSELHEVRQNMVGIQNEMDDVNQQLKEQCGRVQHVEGSLMLSRDLGEKVRAMREMVQESHGALAQLCEHLERERARREDCSQGLKQQRVRTELLLQLLHHFKSRTRDLVPQQACETSWSEREAPLDRTAPARLAPP